MLEPTPTVTNTPRDSSLALDVSTPNSILLEASWDGIHLHTYTNSGLPWEPASLQARMERVVRQSVCRDRAGRWDRHLRCPHRDLLLFVRRDFPRSWISDQEVCHY